MASTDMIDLATIREQSSIMGNGAHELRNLLAMTKKPELPELVAIDTLVAQVENQCRQFIQISLIPQNLLKPDTGKTLLRAIFRTNAFVLRNLNLDSKELGYSLMAKDLLDKVIENVKLQQNIVKNLDKILNQAFTSYLDGDIDEQVLVGKQFKDQKIYQSLDFTKIKIDTSLEKATLLSLIESAKASCNKAHSIQNAICPYQTIEKVKNSANQVNNHAGNIENQFRAILLSFGQQTNNPDQVKKTIQNQVKAAIEQMTIIHQHQQTISEFYPKEMAVIKTSCDEISSSLQFFSKVAEKQIIQILS